MTSEQNVISDVRLGRDVNHSVPASGSSQLY